MQSAKNCYLLLVIPTPPVWTVVCTKGNETWTPPCTRPGHPSQTWVAKTLVVTGCTAYNQCTNLQITLLFSTRCTTMKFYDAPYIWSTTNSSQRDQWGPMSTNERPNTRPNVRHNTSMGIRSDPMRPNWTQLDPTRPYGTQREPTKPKKNQWDPTRPKWFASFCFNNNLLHVSWIVQWWSKIICYQ